MPQRPLSVNFNNQSIDYRCLCGKLVQIPVVNLKVGVSTDYCGCGRQKYDFSAFHINLYRQGVGLPPLEDEPMP
jgi:hypothetical protein